MKTLDQITQFIEENHSPVLAWEQGRLREWLNFFLCRDLIRIVTENGMIIGLGMGRVVKNPKAFEPYEHDEKDGTAIVIDLLVALKRDAQGLLWRLAVDRLGARDYLVFKRTKHGDRLRVYNLKTFFNRLK